MAVTIQQLAVELTTLIKSVPAFTDSGFYVFDIDDLEDKVEGQDLPLAAVWYNGCVPPDNPGGTATDRRNSSVAMVSMRFMVVIAISYQYRGQNDTKQQATDLLDEIRSKVLGYYGVNSRPWRFIGERPEPNASGDGVAYYSQIWDTDVPVRGTFSQT